MRLHNDEPTLLDQLARLDLVRRVGEDVATCDPPHVFGIHGDWGSGKTSFLHQLQAYLATVLPSHMIREHLQHALKPCWGIPTTPPQASPARAWW